MVDRIGAQSSAWPVGEDRLLRTEQLSREVMLEGGYVYVPALELSVERLDEQALASAAAAKDGTLVHDFSSHRRRRAGSYHFQRSAHIKSRDDPAGRRGADPDEAADRDACALIIDHVTCDMACKAPIDDLGPPDERMKQNTAHGIKRSALGVIEAKAVTFEHAAPGESLGTRQLMDAVARIDEFLDELGHSPWSRGSARVTGVFVEKAVRYENNAAAACIPKPVEQQPRRVPVLRHWLA